MSDVLIKSMGMPEGCYYCPILIGKANCSCAITGTKIRIEKVREEMEDERMPDCPLVEHLDSSWHTGTPTEGGWYLAKVTDVDKPYEVLKFENGKWSDYLDYDDVPEVVNDSFVLAYQKIEPFKEATE